MSCMCVSAWSRFLFDCDQVIILTTESEEIMRRQRESCRPTATTGARCWVDQRFGHWPRKRGWSSTCDFACFYKSMTWINVYLHFSFSCLVSVCSAKKQTKKLGIGLRVWWFDWSCRTCRSHDSQFDAQFHHFSVDEARTSRRPG